MSTDTILEQQSNMTNDGTSGTVAGAQGDPSTSKGPRLGSTLRATAKSMKQSVSSAVTTAAASARGVTYQRKAFPGEARRKCADYSAAAYADACGVRR